MTDVLEPHTFGKTELPNRFVLAPMTRVSAEADGSPNQLMARHYERYAKGGFGLLISEGTYTDDLASQGYENQPGLINESHRAAWQRITERVHAAGSKMFVQLMHAGAQMQYNRFTETALAPSAVQPKGEPLGFYGDVDGWSESRAMTEEDIRNVVDGFVHSAKLAVDAGFDGIELHGANGYLLNEFISDYFNRRDDENGGDLQARSQLLLRVVRAVTDAVGADVPVGMRLSQITITDPEYRLPEGHAGFRRLIEDLRDAGLDFVHTTDNDAAAAAFDDADESLAQVVSEVDGLGLIINGGITELNYQSLANDYPQALLAVGKRALANPDFVQRLKDGKTMDELDFNMLLPKATISNEMRWREEAGAQ